MNLSDFDYNLDENLIAQQPAHKRENSRLLYLNRKEKTYQDKNFSDILELLSSDDLLVLNNTKVFPARIIGKKKTGAKYLHPTDRHFILLPMWAGPTTPTGFHISEESIIFFTSTILTIPDGIPCTGDMRFPMI